MDKIKIDESQFEYLSDGIVRPSSFIRRFSQGNNRFYYTLDDSGDVKLYSSGTTLIGDGYAENTSHLEEWRNKLKSEGKNPSNELKYLATRGTLMHLLFGALVQGYDVPLMDLHKFFSDEFPEVTGEFDYNRVISIDSEWLVKAVLSFKQFVRDYNVKPLAIELMLKSDKYDVASPIDMICQMTIQETGFFGEVYKTGVNKGEPKTSKRSRDIIAIVDFKSSKGFFDKHALQLLLYKQIVSENYPEMNIEGLFNFSPREWTGEVPSYNLKDQFDSKLDQLSHLVFEQGKIKHSWKNPTVTEFDYSIGLYDDKEIVFKKIPLITYLKDFHGKRD